MGKALGLGFDDVVVPAAGYRDLLDALYVLEAALSDVERDLRRSREPEEYRNAFQHLYAAAAGLRGVAPDPTALGA
jgi:hypothetical protein